MKVKMIVMSATDFDPDDPGDQFFIVPEDFDHQGVLDGRIPLEMATKRIIAQAETSDWGARIVEALNAKASH